MTDDFDPRDHFEQDRLDKAESLRNRGETPYANESERDISLGAFRHEYDDQEEYDNPPTHTLGGRITRVNDFGSVMFADIEDEEDTIQLFFYDGDTEAFDDRSCIDEGDYVEATGEPTRTDNGELSLLVDEWEILTKALRGIPTRTGLDERNRVRDRVGALIVDDDLHDAVSTRFDVMAELRRTLRQRGFQEVDTPTLHHTASGASATPFETHCEALDEEMALRIAPELYLKRLVMGGFERVFELGSNFRNEDIDTTHNPEFTMLELYEAYADYEDMMILTEEVVSSVVYELTLSYELEYDDSTLDFEPPWPRQRFEEVLEEYGGVPVTDLSDDDLRELAETEYGISFDGDYSRGRAYEELYEAAAEANIDGPLFVTDHPRESTPLCAPHSDDPSRVERFEVVVAGVELANAYSELTDPVMQGELFAEQANRQSSDEQVDPDMSFADDLGYGMPPTGGLGLGVDRLAMLVSNSQSIKEVLPFPLVASE